MPALLIGILALVAVVAWMVRPRSRPGPAPEDDTSTPIDEVALRDAERELREDSAPRDAAAGAAEEDDWGPGVP